jgi:hypothetical protein|tara:strand:+ start:278 stop:499 length:222 start_codon:yes stop_codon:yes gene_type:complete
MKTYSQRTSKQYARRYIIDKCGLKQGTMTAVVDACDDEIYAWMVAQTAKGGYKSLAEFIADITIEYYFSEENQ